MEYLFHNFSVFVITIFFLIYSTIAMSVHPKKSDGDWIDMSGTVVSSTSDMFVLDYCEGLITVEMDDWDWYKEGWPIINGDDVIAHGCIDADLFEKHTIEASSVYVKGINTYYYTSAKDEEDIAYINMYIYPAPIYYDCSWMNECNRQGYQN